jgi:hypothetical protein
MTLTTEDMDEVIAPSEETLDEILSSDSFGKFAALSAADDKFIQIASAWSPSDECQAFLSEHRSDPWILEMCDGGSATHLRARGFVTLEAAQRAFKGFLKGEKEWTQRFEWESAPND